MTSKKILKDLLFIITGIFWLILFLSLLFPRPQGFYTVGSDFFNTTLGIILWPMIVLSGICVGVFLFSRKESRKIWINGGSFKKVLLILGIGFLSIWTGVVSAFIFFMASLFRSPGSLS